jgi:hypothetical protein
MKKEFLMNKTTILLTPDLHTGDDCLQRKPLQWGQSSIRCQTATSSGRPIHSVAGRDRHDQTGQYEDAVTAEQAQELLPLWETLKVLESSDTAATQEKDALIEQIQETMSS